MFSELLKKLRSERGVSQTALAKEVGVSPGNIGDWEIGRSKPGYNALAELSRFFGVSADFLLGLTGARQRVASEQCDGVPLSPTEADLVAMFRLLDERGREMIFDTAMMMYEKATGEKGSIYSTYIEDERKQKSDPEEGLEARHGTA